MDISLSIESGLNEICNYYRLDETFLKLTLGKSIQKGENNLFPIITNNGIIRAKWGLVPYYVKGLESAKKSKIYTIEAKHMLFDRRIRGSIRSRRCIVPINYYEINGYKVNVFYKHLFSLGAVYDIWEEDGKRYVGFALIITNSNETLKNSSKYMPVYLKREEEKIWLRENCLRTIKELTGSYNNELWINMSEETSLIK